MPSNQRITWHMVRVIAFQVSFLGGPRLTSAIMVWGLDFLGIRPSPEPFRRWDGIFNETSLCLNDSALWAAGLSA